MDIETKEDGSIFAEGKRLKMDDDQPVNVSEQMINEVIKEQVFELSKINKSLYNEDGIDIADENETESDATTKFPQSSDIDFEPLQPVFVNPDEGTPAAEALAGTNFLTLENNCFSR